MMAVFCFRLASFRFEAIMMAVFCFFFVLFSLRSIFVSLQLSTFRIYAKQAKKALFFASKRKKFRFRFASFRFEAKITAHPNNQLSSLPHFQLRCIPSYLLSIVKAFVKVALFSQFRGVTCWMDRSDHPLCFVYLPLEQVMNLWQKPNYI
jgi:hypothetical protein